MLRKIMPLCVLALFLTGCSSGFTGEWLEDPGPAATGGAPAGQRRMALQFYPPSTVRYGPYVNSIGVVDNQAVQSDTYFLFDRWNRAQFGAMKAEVNGDHMVATVDGETMRHFTRVHGRSIFPPPVQVPEFP